MTPKSLTTALSKPLPQIDIELIPLEQLAEPIELAKLKELVGLDTEVPNEVPNEWNFSHVGVLLLLLAVIVAVVYMLS